MHGNGLERKLSVQPGLYHVPSLTRHFRSWPIVLKKSVGSGDLIFSASWSDLETRTAEGSFGARAMAWRSAMGQSRTFVRCVSVSGLPPRADL